MESKESLKYMHTEIFHNLKDPQIIVPEIIKIIQPKSVVDIGCGIGNFLNVFKEYGVNDILGIDGEWVNMALLSKYIDISEFREADLEKPLKLDKKYDLVISLEVAEHLSEAVAPTFVNSLIDAGHVIVFSAAVPNQPGQNHINEKWLSYWEILFDKHNYVMHNIMRPILWESPVQACYKQNMVIFTPDDYKFETNLTYCNIKDVVHKDLYNLKVTQLEQINTQYKNILNGKIQLKTALKIVVKGLIGMKMWNKLKKSFHTQ